jgi:hypothetical protein
LEEGGDDASGDRAEIDFSPVESEVEEGVADAAIHPWHSPLIVSAHPPA